VNLFQQNHIVSRLLSLVLVIAIITPTLVKGYHHAFEHHENDTSFQKEVSLDAFVYELHSDCELCKFKLNTNFYDTPNVESSTFQQITSSIKVSYYELLHSYSIDASHLRGPPSLA